MAKNNDVINRYKQLYQKIQQITPQVYACIALALHRKHGWGFKRINDLFCESQVIWEECVERNESMIKMCEQETGIDVQAKTQERF